MKSESYFSLRKCTVSYRLLTALILLLLIIHAEALLGQSAFNYAKKRAGRPEKWWAVCHPFIAVKAAKLTYSTGIVLDSIRKAGTIGDDLNGGKLDAFKHSFWMALLSQKLKPRKVRKLGFAHEKSNYLSFKKAKKKGLGNCHDKAASDMDLWNNEKGIEIGLANKTAGRTRLSKIVIDSIEAGAMMIIKKNKNGQFLDCEGNIIPADSLKGRWENDKCLIPSSETISKKD